MVTATRLDCVLGSAAGMRRGTVAAVHHCAHRQSFGRNLIDQPLMTAVLADLAVESEAATTLAMRLAAAAQRAATGGGGPRGVAPAAGARGSRGGHVGGPLRGLRCVRHGARSGGPG